MRKMFKIIFIFTCMIIFFSCIKDNKNSKWEVVKIFKSLPGIAENKQIKNVKIFFLNEDIGFSSVKINNVNYSNDGGETWIETIVPALSNLSKVEIINDKNIVIGIDFQEMRYSDDCGKTWEKIERTAHELFSFCDENTGMIARSVSITMLRIIENNKIVDEIKISKEFEKTPVIALSCLSVNEAFVLLYGEGTLLITKDRGKTWIKNDLMKAVKNKSVFKLINTDMISMRFTDSNNGTIVVFDSKEKAWACLITKDGGKSWN